MTIEQRRFRRYEVLDLADMRFAHSASRAVVVNVGFGGVEIHSPRGFHVGDQCDLHLNVDKASATLRAEVRYTETRPNSSICATGIQFLPKSHSERIAIAELVDAAYRASLDQPND